MGVLRPHLGVGVWAPKMGVSLIRVLQSGFNCDSRFPSEAAGTGTLYLVPASHAGDLDYIPTSWSSTIMGIWGSKLMNVSSIFVHVIIFLSALYASQIKNIVTLS